MVRSWKDYRLRHAMPAPGSRVRVYGKGLDGADATVREVAPAWNEEREKADWISQYDWGWPTTVELDDPTLLDPRMLGTVEIGLNEVLFVSGSTVDPRQVSDSHPSAFDAFFDYRPLGA